MARNDWLDILGGPVTALLFGGDAVAEVAVPEHTKWSINPIAPDWPLPTDAEVDALWLALKRGGGARGLSATDLVYLRPYLRHAYNVAAALVSYPYDADLLARERAWMLPKMRAAVDELAARVGAYSKAVDNGNVTASEQAEDQVQVLDQVEAVEAGGGIPPVAPVGFQVQAGPWKWALAAAVAAGLWWVLRRG